MGETEEKEQETAVRKQIVRWLIVAMMMPHVAWAQSSYKTGEPVSPKLAMAGVITIIAGWGVMFHPSEDDVHVLNSTYCVSDTGDVEYGSCSSPMEYKVGAIMIGSGVLMTWLGMRSKRVKVSPTLGPNVMGAQATIQWGGKANAKR